MPCVKIHFVARVLHVREPAQQAALVHAIATVQVQHHREIGLRIAEAIFLDNLHGIILPDDAMAGGNDIYRQIESDNFVQFFPQEYD